ncbi:MAG: hypothetical protein Solivirus1_85 [Solivirus sp.]|uniref:Ankyrin repeat protein n=1 Tax=Solivirus sp. TaxID=2487772 RepID=A0A3G5AFL8_9VIRU|nr:MAG: hypothetical protein Solivirus1_85 [Solivirus sp.]
MEQFPFRNLPLEVKIQFLANVNEKEFDTLNQISEFDYLLHEYPNSERVYEERSKRKFTDLVQFKDQDVKPMTWKEFYVRMIAIISQLNVIVLIISDLIRCNKLMELKVISELAPEEFIREMNRYVDNVAACGHIQMLQWLETKKILPDKIGMDYSIGNGHLDVAQWLADRNINPTQEGAKVAAFWDKIDSLEWIYNNFGLLPDAISVADAANRGSINVLDWAYSKGVKPERRNLKPREIQRYPEVVNWFVEHTKK